MHFLTLVPVTVPAQEPDPLKDVLVQATLMELREKMESDPKDFMAKIFASELTGKVTPFGRAVFDAVYEKMDPYAVETDHPACREFVDCTDEIREEYRTGTIDCVRLADGTVVERFDPRFRNRFSVKDGRIVQNDFGPLHHKKRSKKAKKMTWLPNYPKKKLYRSERELAETYYGYDYLPEEDAYGYYSNTAAFYDWHAIGGRWPHLFLVPEDCTEYTFGDYEGTEEETKGPEGYRWVAAARKKDIAWDVMAKLAQQRQKEAYSLLKTAYETRELPEKSFLSFTCTWTAKAWKPSSTGTAAAPTASTSSPPAVIWRRAAMRTPAFRSAAPRMCRRRNRRPKAPEPGPWSWTRSSMRWTTMPFWLALTATSEGRCTR